VGKWGGEIRKAGPGCVSGAEFHGNTLGNDARHSPRIISSEDEEADVFYVPTLESYWIRPAEEGEH
jgi:hypothetical protein